MQLQQPCSQAYLLEFLGSVSSFFFFPPTTFIEYLTGSQGTEFISGPEIVEPLYAQRFILQMGVGGGGGKTCPVEGKIQKRKVNHRL